MSFEIKGLKEAQDKLKKMTKAAEELDGTSVPMSEVLNDSFIAQHSSHESFEKLVESSGFKAESQEDFDNLPDEEWNSFIKKNTNFSSWQEMIDSAGAIYAKKKFGL